MKVLKYRHYGINYAQIWYADKRSDLTSISNVDIIELHESYSQIDNHLFPFKNGVILLNKPLSEIHSNFEKGFSYEIRRAEKEGIKCKALFVNRDTLQNIYSRYERFCRSKHVTPIAIKFFALYLESGTLEISVSEINSVCLQYHIYFSSEKEIVLLASFPDDKACVKRNMYGYANRLLHWFDIQNAANTKKEIYNLGGIGNSADKTIAGIIRFKMEMMPTTSVYYNGILPITRKGMWFLKLKKLLKSHD